ncbi:MAG: hypothetical protein JSV04_06705, partial [Candidatus Heimdallarchaeota archaeon]
ENPEDKIGESEIMKDLFASTPSDDSSSNLLNQSLSPNQRRFDEFLNDEDSALQANESNQRESTDSIKIDFCNETDDTLGREEFNTRIVNEINESTEAARMKEKPNSELWE